MENGESIEQTLISLYTQLQDPGLTNAKYVTDTILSIYSSPAVIPSLLNLMQNPNPFLKHLACIGLKHSLHICSSNIDPSLFKNIWEQLFAFAIQEQNLSDFNFLMDPMIETFRITQQNWESINDHIMATMEVSHYKAYQIISSLIPYVPRDYINLNEPYFRKIIEIGLTSPDKYSIFKFTYPIFFYISKKYIYESQELYENFASRYSEPFSILLSELLSNGEKMKEIISPIFISAELLINPFKINILFQPIIGALQNQDFSISLKYCIIQFLDLLICQDDTFTLDDKTFNDFIRFLLLVSIEMFNKSDDIEDPDSSVIGDLFNSLFARIPIETITQVVFPVISECLSSQSVPDIYNALLLFNSCLNASEDILLSQIDQIITICVTCFQLEAHPALKNEAALLFISHSMLYSSLTEEQKCEIISLILNIITSTNEFYCGLNVVLKLIEEMNDTDSLFEDIFPFCDQLIKSGMANLSALGWEILISMCKYSNGAIIELFDTIFPYCLEIIQTVGDNDEDDNVAFSIRCIGILVEKCTVKISEQMASLCELFFTLFSNSNNLETKNSILTVLHSFVRMIPEVMITYLPPFLDELLPVLADPNRYSLSIDESERRTAKLFLEPSIELTRICIHHYQEYYLNQEKILSLLQIIKNNLEGMFTPQIKAALLLLKTFISFTITYNLDFMSVNSQFLAFIIDKVKSEIDMKLKSTMFDVLHTAVSLYGLSFLNGIKAWQLFDIVLSVVDFSNEQINDDALLLLNAIVQNLNDPDQETIEKFQTDFIPRILQTLNEDYVLFSLNLLTEVVIITDKLISKEMVMVAIQKSLENIDIINENTIPSVIFLDSLIYHYQDLLNQINEDLIALILTKIPTLDVENDQQAVISEYLITLLIILEMNFHEFNDESLMKYILSFLPIKISQHFNNKYVYLFLLKSFNVFPSLQNQILQIIVSVCINHETIEESCIPPELSIELLKFIFQINLLENPQLISELFNEDDQKAASFIRTMTFFAEKFNSSQ